LKRSDASPRNTAGLTLVELLIVLFIVGLGWFTLLPRLDPTRPSGSSAPLHEMNVSWIPYPEGCPGTTPRIACRTHPDAAP